MRTPTLTLLAFLLAPFGCGPQVATGTRPTPTPSPLPPAEQAGAPPPPCKVSQRLLSVSTRGSVQPDVAAGADGGFGVSWEETEESHRGIHFQALDAHATPLGPSVEVADLARGGAEPHVVADGDGYAIVWTVDEPDTTQIVLRRVDGRGVPLSDVVTAVEAKNARALALGKVKDGFALAWWTWSASPPQQSVSWLDGDGKPRGKPVVLFRGELVEPAVDLREDGGVLRAAWVEPVGGMDHVLVGVVGRRGLDERRDIGAGNGPSLGSAGVTFAQLTDATVWRSPLDRAAPAKLTDGQSPVQRDGTLCLYRPATQGDSAADQLRCLTVDDKVVRDDLVTAAPGGVLTLRAAHASIPAVVWQTEENDVMAVRFATVECGK